MSPLLQWCLLYTVPALTAFLFKRRESNVMKRTAYIHLFVVASVVLLTVFGQRLNWSFNFVFISVCLLTIAVAIFLLGRLGLAYVFSCFIQEWCLLLAGSLLATVVPLPAAALATAIPFALAHKTNSRTWKSWTTLLIPYLFLGIGTIYLYQWLEEPLLNVAIHILVGGALIKANVLFTSRHEVKWKK